MPDTTARLSLPHILPAQAQKHVTHNEALAALDVIVQLSVASFDATTPPAAPVEGEVHAIGAGTGDWAGQDGQLAAFVNAGWMYLAPQTGWRAWGLGDSSLRVWDGSAWVVQGGGTGSLNNLPGVGVGGSYDATNRLVVASPASLFNNAGAGHQIKVNKATPTDTASLLFQTGFSGRAEMGTSGSDDFEIKVSADGNSFAPALTLQAATGMAQVQGVSGAPVLLDDDTATMITPPTPAGFALITVTGSDPQAGCSAIVVQDTGSTPQLQSLFATPLVDLQGTTPLTGTTASDGTLGVSAVTGGLWIENRLGSTQNISVTFLGGL